MPKKFTSLFVQGYMELFVQKVRIDIAPDKYVSFRKPVLQFSYSFKNTVAPHRYPNQDYFS